MKLCSCGTNYKCISCRNTEEESKLDELKVYTGKETLQALLEGRIVECTNPKIKYKIEDDTLYQEGFTGWSISDLQLTDFLNLEFTEVATPQVGDWVRVYLPDRTTVVGCLTGVDTEFMYAKWNRDCSSINLKHDWQILSPEEVSEYKREQAFAKVGRKLNEFKRGDIVYIDSVYRVAIVASNNNTSLISLHGINEEGKGYTAKTHQLTPISFVEQQVDLS